MTVQELKHNIQAVIADFKQGNIGKVETITEIERMTYIAEYRCEFKPVCSLIAIYGTCPVNCKSRMQEVYSYDF